ncbi:MAG: asparagine synthase (glutamine-hydrolyzing) [Coriobacteriia bacterium]|nr:asparagine synthase (glutamine-hydrolyzing) [Coriobacteriia bacterium]
MSGICGFIGPANEVENRERVLQAMKDRIAHRGPDDEGSHYDKGAALGFRRLSIIDLAHGHQPLLNEDGTVVVTCDGIIYNHLELRAELKARGHHFATNTDAEVIVHGWEEYGQALLDRLNGMFAFIVWDARTQSAFGARDFFGVKPFHFTQRGDTLIYASEIKSLFAYPGVAPQLNLEALEQYLSFQYSALPETFFKGIFKLSPGECFTFKEGALTTRRYFDPLPAATTVAVVREKMAQHNTASQAKGGLTYEDPFAYTVDQVKQVIEQAVDTCMLSDVELGSLLSSGIDSSYIAALNPSKRAFTVGFETADGVKYNEISYAKLAADELGKTHISRVITAEEYWDSVPRIMYHMDEPLADPSAVALYFLHEMVSKDVKVVFSGEGADEFFGGYPIYHEPLGLAGFQKLPRGLRRGLAAIARAIPFRFKGKSFLNRAAKTVEERYISNAYLFTVAEREALLKAPVKAPPPESLTQPFYAKVAGALDTNKMQYIDYNFWVPGDIMLKGDRMAAAHGVESRMPLLDLRVFALANTLPLEYLLNDETTKLTLRAAAHDVLPERITTKPKLGFPVPTRVWLKEDRWYNRVRLAFEGETAQQFFNTDLLVRLLDEHRTGKADNSRKIWNVYVFLVWYQVFF